MFRSILYPILKPKIKKEMSFSRYGPYFLEKYNYKYKEIKNISFQPIPIQIPFIKNEIIESNLLEISNVKNKIPSFVLFCLIGFFIFLRTKEIKTI